MDDGVGEGRWSLTMRARGLWDLRQLRLWSYIPPLDTANIGAVRVDVDRKMKAHRGGGCLIKLSELLPGV